MKAEIIDWKEDLPAEPNEEYKSLVRALKWEEGFGLFFVECSPAGGQQIMAKLREDIPGKKFDVLPLDENVYNFYELVEGLPNREDIDVLFVTGLEYSLFLYEKEKREEGWDSKEIYSYSSRGILPLLVNLNQQRERFRDNFDICFVFLMPRFAINYFLLRAPDFFDWRSGLFQLPMDVESFQSKRKSWEDYQTLTYDAIKQELIKVQSLIDEDGQTDKLKADLWIEQGQLFAVKNQYQEAINAYNNALQIKPDYHFAWKGKGDALLDLGKYEEAIAAYEQAIIIKPDYYSAWNNKGIALKNLGMYEEAVAAYNQVLKLQPYYHDIWYNKGVALQSLKRYEEAIACYNEAIKIQPDHHHAWRSKADLLDNLGRHEEAIVCYDKAIEIKPDYYYAWNDKGIVLVKLKRYEEAKSCYDKAIEIQPENDYAWGNKGYLLRTFLKHYEEAIACYEKALKIQPDDPDYWNDMGLALVNIERYEEAMTAYDRAIEIKPDYNWSWYNKACCYAVQGNTELAIINLQQAINLDGKECIEWAKTDTDFDSLRKSDRFQELINQQTD